MNSTAPHVPKKLWHVSTNFQGIQPSLSQAPQQEGDARDKHHENHSSRQPRFSACFGLLELYSFQARLGIIHTRRSETASIPQPSCTEATSTPEEVDAWASIICGGLNGRGAESKPNTFSTAEVLRTSAISFGMFELGYCSRPRSFTLGRGQSLALQGPEAACVMSGLQSIRKAEKHLRQAERLRGNGAAVGPVCFAASGVQENLLHQHIISVSASGCTAPVK